MKRSLTGFLVLFVVFVMGFAILSSGCGRQAPEKPAETEKAAGESQTESELSPEPSFKPITEERTFYNFEEDLQGWEVPIWVEGKASYVAREVTVSKDFASKGESSMKVISDFPGGKWSAGLVEIQQYLDMSPYRVLRVDLYLPEDAPVGLKAKIILTVGEKWKFVEMNRSIPLVPGEWVTITANIEPGSYDWKRVVPDEKFAQDVRKIAIRIESNRQPVYAGPTYIDNIRVGR